MAIENLTDLEKSLKLDEGTLSKALQSETPVKIELPQLVVRTKDEEDTFIENLKTNHFTAAQEILIKNTKRDLGLDFEGKNINKLIEVVKAKALEEAKIEPDKKVQELAADKAKLQQNIQELESKFQAKEKEFIFKENERKVNDALLSSMNFETAIPTNDVLTLFKSNFQTDLEGDKVVIKKNGEVLKNPTTLSPLSPNEVLAEFAKPYLKTAVITGGGGKKDEPGGKLNSYEAFEKSMTDQNIKPGSAEFIQKMQEAMKSGTLKM